MKLGLFTCGYQRRDLESAFRDAKEFGYDYVELWGGYPHTYVYDLKEKGVDSINALIDKYGVKVKCFTPEHNAYPFNYMAGDMVSWERCMKYLEAAIEITRDIGADYMLFSSGHAGDLVGKYEIMERLKISLDRLVKKAEECNVTLIFEPLTVYETNTINNLETLKEALELNDSSNLVGMLDLAVSHSNKEDAADYVRELGERFAYLHLIDNDGESDNHFVPGDGNMDLKEVISDIRNAGFDGCATIEIVTNYLSDPSYYAKLSIDRVKALME